MNDFRKKVEKLRINLDKCKDEALYLQTKIKEIENNIINIENEIFKLENNIKNIDDIKNIKNIDDINFY